MKLKFFKKVADRLKSFLVTFQTDAPMVPLLVDKLEKVVRFYCSRFILPATMEKVNSTPKLIKLGFFYDNVYWPDVEVGYGIAEELRKLKSKDKIKDDVIHKLKESAEVFLSHFVSIWLRRALCNIRLHVVLVLNPVYMAEKQEFCKALFDKTLQKLVEYKQVLPNIADFAKQEFDCFLTLIVKAKKQAFCDFDFNAS